MQDIRNEKTFTSLKRANGDKGKSRLALVALNFSIEEADIHVPGELRYYSSLELMVGSTEPPNVTEKLKPWEGSVYPVDG